jgi:hypothetical protein
MDVTRRNLEVFNKGMAKMDSLIKKKFLFAGLNLASDLVINAVEAYQDDPNAGSLTGNLLNSIAGGVYYNGVLERICTANKHARIPVQTHRYARVGDGGFKDYDSGEIVDFVNQYAGSEIFFQPVDKNKAGLQSALEFLSSYKASMKLEIIICAAAPYAEYLQSERNLDILTSAYAGAERELRQYIKLIKL